MWDMLTLAQKTEMQEKGVIYEPSEYGAPVPYTLKLVEDGRRHLLLRAPIAITCPVHLIQGKEDKDVPWQVAEKLAKQLISKDVRVTYIEDGEHRLSRDSDLEILWNAVKAML
jgi:alpha-beta hydrolase superfamily lysophospholipase